MPKRARQGIVTLSINFTKSQFEEFINDIDDTITSDDLDMAVGVVMKDAIVDLLVDEYGFHECECSMLTRTLYTVEGYSESMCGVCADEAVDYINNVGNL
jgi:hypothetical protein